MARIDSISFSVAFFSFSADAEIGQCVVKIAHEHGFERVFDFFDLFDDLFDGRDSAAGASGAVAAVVTFYSFQSFRWWFRFALWLMMEMRSSAWLQAMVRLVDGRIPKPQ